MKRYRWLFWLLVVVGLLLGVAYRQRSKVSSQIPANDSLALTKQEQEAGGVTVAVTPEDVVAGTFAIELTTHSVELDQDLTQAVTLVDEDGREYRPIQWEGSEPGGHHRAGKLQFGRIEPVPRRFKLIIKGLGGVEQLKFEWMTTVVE